MGIPVPRHTNIVDGISLDSPAITVADSLRQIERCRYRSGLYSAVPADSTERLEIYSAVWIRDSVYTLLAFEAIGDLDRLRTGVYDLLDRILLRWAYKLDWCIVKGIPTQDYEYLHPRYSPNGDELHSQLWGLRQDDAIGLLIWALCRWQNASECFETTLRSSTLSRSWSGTAVQPASPMRQTVGSGRKRSRPRRCICRQPVRSPPD